LVRIRRAVLYQTILEQFQLAVSEQIGCDQRQFGLNLTDSVRNRFVHQTADASSFGDALLVGLSHATRRAPTRRPSRPKDSGQRFTGMQLSVKLAPADSAFSGTTCRVLGTCERAAAARRRAPKLVPVRQARCSIAIEGARQSIDGRSNREHVIVRDLRFGST